MSGLWKVFGATPQRIIDQLSAGASKEEVLAESGHVVAVRNVSFEVHKGQTFVVMGLSGSGKSTLLRCLPRLIEPTRGEITINGQNCATISEEELRTLRRHTMSMVFQNFGLFPHRRIIDNVAYGLEIQGVKKTERYTKARQMLEVVNLKGWENRYPAECSGGMQQRVGLARALAVDPEILLFDEPFSALDPLIRRDMQDELIDLQNRLHKTSIFITHDFAEALKLGDLIAIMKDGEFVQVGTPEEVVLHPADEYVKAFTKDAPRGHVLTARSVMSAVRADAAGEGVPASTKLDQLIVRLLASEAPAPVVDEIGSVIGSIDRADLLRAMSGERL
ncbi:MAG: glycine betaine/L-proline ABC transporter ATP-binding protein [Caldilineaceae bacterium]